MTNNVLFYLKDFDSRKTGSVLMEEYHSKTEPETKHYAEELKINFRDKTSKYLRAKNPIKRRIEPLPVFDINTNTMPPLHYLI